MALITDPDNLSQGTSNAVTDLAFTASSGSRTTLTGASTLPIITAGDFFEIRDSSIAQNNGLYIANTAPTISSITCDKVDGGDPANLSAEAHRFFGNTLISKSVHIDTEQRRVYLLEQGNLSVDGVTEQALYSFMKEEWKDDADLIKFEFPVVAITPEQFEFSNDWEPRVTANTVNISRFAQSKKLIRSGGWSEIDSTANTVLQAQYMGAVTLGSFEDDAADTAYYQFGTDATQTDSTTDFTFAGPVNEAIKTYQSVGQVDTCDFATTSTITRATGSFVDDDFRVGSEVTVTGSLNNDGSYVLTGVSALTLTVTGTPFTAEVDPWARLATDHRKAIKLFIRIRDTDTNGKTFQSSDLTAIGADTGVDNKVFRFPLANQTDLDITATDATISGGGADPYEEVRLRYLDSTYSRDVGETGTANNFGIVVDVGTYSQSQGESGANTSFSSENIGLGTGEVLGDYTGGTLTLHEGTDKGDWTISGTTVEHASGRLDIEVTASMAATESGISFTMDRATPKTASKTEIYEKIQWSLRQAADIDDTTNIVNGKTADGLAVFVGPDLRMGSLTPSNPNGGGTGVIIEGFDSNDTNNLFFFDNTGNSRNFPFVAAGTINFNPNLVTDTNGIYWMFFEYTERFTETGIAIENFSADTTNLVTTTTDMVTELADGDYINLTGFTNSDLDGIFVLTATPTVPGAALYAVDVRRIDGSTLANEAVGASVSLDKNPVNSPDAIIVDNNAGTDLTAATTAASTAFDFDYDNNVQGGRTSGTDANILLRAIGFDTAQFVETTGTITRATGLSFSLVSGLERNYDNS